MSDSTTGYPTFREPEVPDIQTSNPQLSATSNDSVLQRDPITSSLDGTSASPSLETTIPTAQKTTAAEDAPTSPFDPENASPPADLARVEPLTGEDAVEMEKTAPIDKGKEKAVEPDESPARSASNPSADGASKQTVITAMMTAPEDKITGIAPATMNNLGSGSGQAPKTSGSKESNSSVTITLLLPTGARHPYRVDAKYLSKRNIEMSGITEEGLPDPLSISVYTLKELILREWREEWEDKPKSPTSIRLIHFGKLLADKDQLKKYRLSSDGLNVIHMSVKPQDLIEEDEATHGNPKGAQTQSRRGGVRCCIIL